MNFDKINCSKCSHINPPHKNICENCKNHLRERVVNIDLWDTVLSIIENPKTAFKNIVYAEHKNFIYFLLFFISIKNIIIARFISAPEIGLTKATSSTISVLILSIIITTLFFVINASLFQLFSKKNIIKLRFIDIFSMNVYSFVPFIIGLVIVFPVELIVLGSDIFSNNPYPFQIKPTITYILISFEVLLILWTILLYFKSSTMIFANKIKSTLLGLFFATLWFSLLFVAAKFIFTL